MSIQLLHHDFPSLCRAPSGAMDTRLNERSGSAFARITTLIISSTCHRDSQPTSPEFFGFSSSGSKRKRGNDDGGLHHPLTRASSTSDFSNTVKANVIAEYGNKCWHCGASPADVCLVIGSRDNTFQTALEDGLIDFQNKRHHYNAISLCGTCHCNFDDSYEPSFFFLPTDLDYFLLYEKEHRKRRRRLGRREGFIPARTCPTAQIYQDHQIRQGVQGTLSGGLYTRIVLRDFLPQYPGRAAFVPGLSEYSATKSWPGSPMAALQRAVAILRKLNLHGIPQDIKKALRDLQDIYSEPINIADEGSDDDTNADETGHGHESESEHGPGNRGQSHHIKDSSRLQQAGIEDGFVHRGGRPRGLGDQRKATALDEEFAGTEVKKYKDESIKSPFSQSDNFLTPPSLAIQVSSPRDSSGWSRHWRWGPGATSHDAVKFYNRVL